MERQSRKRNGLLDPEHDDGFEVVTSRSGRGYVKELNGKPLTAWLTTFQLADCRKLFRHRAATRGSAPSTAEIDDALWLTLETGEIPHPFMPDAADRGAIARSQRAT
jgi:hypothetical protein